MNSRQRVLASIERKPIDRPPTSLRCTAEVWDALQQHFGVRSNTAVLDALDIDMRWIGLPFIGPKERSAPPLFGVGTDFWGVLWTQAGNDYNTYYDIKKSPLDWAQSVADVDSHCWPSLDWWDYSAIPGLIEEHCQKDERAILFFAGGAFETPWYIRGFERFMMDLYDNPSLVDAICSRVTEYYMQRALRVLDAADGRIDIIGSGGDIGGELSMILSPAVWRKRIKPYSRLLIETFKQMGLKTFYHSCGSLVPVIDDFIDMGLDVLDPIQVTANGMQPEVLFDRFGDRLSFHGAIDEVHLLPNATPEEVYRETTRMINVLGRNNGYIVSPSHQVQGDTPIENIISLFDAVMHVAKQKQNEAS